MTFPSASDLVATVEDAGCITTATLARKLGLNDQREELRLVLLRLVASGDLVLASYGWDYSYAWTTPELAEDMAPANRFDPWYLPTIDRMGIMREVTPALAPSPAGRSSTADLSAA